MEVLEIKPINNKNVTVYLITVPKVDIEINKINCLTDYLNTNELKFITIDVESENFREFLNTRLGKSLEKLEIPYYLLDIPEYAKGYLEYEIIEIEEQLSELIEELLRMKDTESIKGQNLKSWIYLIEEEIKEKKSTFSLYVRPKWIAKKIVDLIRNVKSEKVLFVHFTKKDIFMKIARIFKDLDMQVIALNDMEKGTEFNIITSQEEINLWKF
ncbi:MAG: hypothetical protein ACFE8A_10515 [Candidatus Hodarchaeota archaeon]